MVNDQAVGDRIAQTDGESGRPRTIKRGKTPMGDAYTVYGDDGDGADMEGGGADSSGSMCSVEARVVGLDQYSLFCIIVSFLSTVRLGDDVHTKL